MRKFPVFLFSVVVLVLFAACGSKNGSAFGETIVASSRATQEAANRTETDNHASAIRFAQTVVRDENVSRRKVIDALVNDGFSAEAAAYGADHCDADWAAEALACAKTYIENGLYGTRVRMALEMEDQFTLTEISYAMEQMDPQPQKTAIRFAQTIVRDENVSRRRVVDTLINDGFSAEAAAYGADHCDADWAAEALTCAKEYMKSYKIPRSRLISALEADDFTPAEAAYAADHYSDAAANTQTYLCWIMKSGAEQAITYEISPMDAAKFDELVRFAARNSYDPFKPNDRIKTRKVSFSIWHEPKIRFFLKENSTVGAGDFYVWDGKLVLLYQTWSDEYALVVDPPEALGQYFMKFLKE